jgi:hypothetical protein
VPLVKRRITEGDMAKKHSILLTALMIGSALGAVILLLTAPSWSSSAHLVITSAAPATLPAAGTGFTLRGNGFSPSTRLWLVPERSIRSATTATLETYGNPHHLIHRDDHLYVANGIGGFFIVTGLQSSVPIISGMLDSSGQGMEIVLHRNEAVLAAGNAGLQLIDIRDDANPQLLSVLKSVVPALSVASSGTIVYVAMGKAGVAIVDLSDPRHPRRLGVIPDLPEAYKLCSDGEILVIATATGGWLYDLLRPEQPRRLAALPVPGGKNTVMTRQGETLYWATKSTVGSRLYALDLSRPSASRLLSSAPLSGVPFGISYNEGQVAVALGSSGTQLFSLEARSLLFASTTIAAKSRTHTALLLGRDLWVADSGGELLRLDQQGARALTAPPILPDFSPRLPPIVTPQLYILGDKNGLSIFDRWEDAAPTLLAQLPLSGLEQHYLSADSRQLWLVTRDPAPAVTGKLLSVDLSLSHAPRIAAEIPFASPPVIIGEHGTTLVITTPTLDPPLSGKKTDGLKSLHLLDTSLLQSPARMATYPLAHVSAGLSVTEHGLVLMQSDGLLRLLDLRDAKAPQELGTLQMPWLHTAAWTGRVNIVVKDDLAFISSPLGEIFLIDLQDPRRPKNLGFLALAGPVISLLINDHFLLAAVQKEGLVVIDLERPRAPALLGTIPLPGLVHNGTVQGGTLWYVKPEVDGFWSLPLPRRLESTRVDDQLVASLAQQPSPGAYRLWVTDEQSHLLVPGVSWSTPRPQAR